jgi:hypothetical protein
MSQTANESVPSTETKAKRQNIFIPAIKFGVGIAFINTLVDGSRIWSGTPSGAYIQSSSGVVGGNGLFAYKLSMLMDAAITNLIMWFVVALIMLFVLRQLKKV